MEQIEDLYLKKDGAKTTLDPQFFEDMEYAGEGMEGGGRVGGGEHNKKSNPVRFKKQKSEHVFFYINFLGGFS